MKTWSKNYYRIINRYEATVAGQFFGHTHFDEFQLFYDENQPSRAISAVLDHQNWYLDLKEANLYNRPRWRHLYSAKEAYGMRSLDPQEWDYLVHKLTFSDDMFKLYYKFYWKASPVRAECDEDCKERLLCDLVSGKSNDRAVTCAKLKERMDENNETGWRSWIVNGLSATTFAVLLSKVGVIPLPI
ncbi:unnamed protein product [Cyprideis torosa]|uniref:Uncharacterized protein n=1 Tax=Cyprideis torosa TaxID=163714 RepID=A0A7R8WJH1_9CRUS|nr:unnamed protein product [Cyprideis torosa]CAG0901974.1 unnamed protein product [Cyprideis torosa]